jgi:competence protein ComEC
LQKGNDLLSFALMREKAIQRDAPLVACRPLVVMAVAFALGVSCDRFGSPSTSLSRAVGWWVAAVVCVAAWGVLRSLGRGGWLRQLGTSLLCASTLAAGAAWHHARWNIFKLDEIGRHAAPQPEPTCIAAIALESPRTLPPIPPSPYRAIPVGVRSQLEIRLIGIRVGRKWQTAQGRARLRVNGQLLGVAAGDRLRIFAEIQSPYEPRNPGEFDYARHARAERRLAELRCGFPECVQKLRSGNWYDPSRALDRVRAWCLERLNDRLGPQNGPIAAALVLGVREGITRKEMEAYQATGTIHLLVVSGLHVSILAGVAYFLFSLCFSSRRESLVGTASLIVLFMLVTGGQPSVVRATVATLAVLAALVGGRRVAAWNVLGGAALAVMALNPADLFRPGPQFSFLAVATLIWCAQRDRRRKELQSPLDRIRREARPLPVQLGYLGAEWAARVLFVTICLWLVSLPLVMCQFHLAAPVALLLAPFVLTSAWVGLNSGFALLAADGLLPIVSGLFGSICSTSIEFLRQAVAIGEALPGGHFSVAGPPAWWTIGTYGGLAMSLMAGPRLPRRWKVAALSLWVALGLAAPGGRQGPTGSLQCTFLSMGHGTCVVLQTPDGRCLLYDAGSLASPDLAVSTIAAYLWSEGIARLDGVILSHADIDHFNAVPGILDHFAVRGLFVSPVMFDPVIHPAESSAPRRLQTELAERNVPTREIYGGDRLKLGGGVTAEVLHPPREGIIGSDNANSIVLAVDFAGRRILLTGDLEPPGVDDVLAELPYDVDVLLAPHHGSRFSDPPGLATWCTPEWVIVSGGDEHGSSAAAETYRDAGAAVLHTSRHGAVRIHATPSGVQVSTWTGSRWQAVPVPAPRTSASPK